MLKFERSSACNQVFHQQHADDSYHQVEPVDAQKKLFLVFILFVVLVVMMAMTLLVRSTIVSWLYGFPLCTRSLC